MPPGGPAISQHKAMCRQSLRCLHVGGLGLVHQRELVELLDVEQRLEQPRLEDPNNPHDGVTQLPLILLGVEACEV